MEFVTAQHGANATVATPTTVCRAGAAASEVSLYTYISKLSSSAGICLSCLEFMIVPTGAGSFAKDMITDSEVYHMLNVGHQENVRRDACNVGDWTDFALEYAGQQPSVGLLHGVS